MRHRASRLVHILAMVPVAAAAATVATPRTSVLAAAPSPQQVVIAIDAGHGGTADNNHPELLFDPGVVARNGLLEKDLTLDVARRVRTLLEADGVRVVMTRDSDTYIDISPRMDAANAAGAKLFVSIHFNYFTDPAISGSLVLYPNNASLAFAQVMTGALDKRVSSFNLQSNPPVLDDQLWIHATMPAVTLEPAYLSNFHDADLLRHNELRAAIAASVRDGVEIQAPEILQLKASVLAHRATQAKPVVVSHPLRLASVPLPSIPVLAAVAVVALLVLLRRAVLPVVLALVGGSAAFVAARLGYAPPRSQRRRAGRRHAPPPTWSPPPRRARRRSARPSAGAPTSYSSRHR